MIEKVVNRKNMRRAYQQVLRNEGSAGVDGMSVLELSKHLKVNRDKIATAVCNGSYLPQPILGIEIPKSKGKRLLGIPTVIDRLLQQAVSQVMSGIFEKEFKAHSYGFRPNKNAQQAVQQSAQYIKEVPQVYINNVLISFFDVLR